jgi:hypothetical protein
MKPSAGKQFRSLVSFVPNTIQWYWEAWQWRREYGAPRDPLCRGSRCWVLVWEDPDSGYTSSIDHVDFQNIARLGPSLECFIYEKSCGCTAWWFGKIKYIVWKCPEHWPLAD